MTIPAWDAVVHESAAVDVLAVGDCLHVPGVTALSVPTQMVDDQAAGDEPVFEQVGDTMGADPYGVATMSGSGDSVSVAVEATLPLPALSRMTHLDMLVKLPDMAGEQVLDTIDHVNHLSGWPGPGRSRVAGPL
jgi:hypothetical protein